MIDIKDHEVFFFFFFGKSKRVDDIREKWRKRSFYLFGYCREIRPRYSVLNLESSKCLEFKLHLRTSLMNLDRQIKSVLRVYLCDLL